MLFLVGLVIFVCLLSGVFNYDRTPDLDHGSVAMITLQHMLKQYENSF